MAVKVQALRRRNDGLGHGIGLMAGRFQVFFKTYKHYVFVEDETVQNITNGERGNARSNLHGTEHQYNKQRSGLM